MAEDIRSLIEKIQKEGVNAAEDKARAIAEEASRRAKEIIAQARHEAEQIVAGATDKARKAEESTKVLLQQAGRDLILALREEIDEMLSRLIESKVHESLTPHELAKIIISLIKEQKEKEPPEIVLQLNKDDLKKLQEGLLGELRESAKKGIVLKSSEDIRGGFIISFDGGKSHFDFTDKALADYIGSCLKPRLGEILKEATS
ncbi:MAG: hypothetical protein C4540_00845 [Candidatus Omnitrophota bacterium]|jgi:vacuolar-type H+-ATPase subunit E/Vma4|nr:MAG: hypothetical protein C4540_00845 [Candidatus Omnitrophota bacterium]